MLIQGTWGDSVNLLLYATSNTNNFIWAASQFGHACALAVNRMVCLQSYPDGSFQLSNTDAATGSQIWSIQTPAKNLGRHIWSSRYTGVNAYGDQENI